MPTKNYARKGKIRGADTSKKKTICQGLIRKHGEKDKGETGTDKGEKKCKGYENL